MASFSWSCVFPMRNQPRHHKEASLITVDISETNITPDQALRVTGLLNPPVVSEVVCPL
jgi:hypothetical protein